MVTKCIYRMIAFLLNYNVHNSKPSKNECCGRMENCSLYTVTTAETSAMQEKHQEKEDTIKS